MADFKRGFLGLLPLWAGAIPAGIAYGVPVALLTALVMSSLAGAADDGPERLVAVAGAAIVARWTGQMWACILSGMAASRSDRWSKIRERTLVDPATRARYERTRRSVLATRQVLQLIDAERERAGLTKSELAERIGTSPATVRRLLTSDSANPTLRTILDLFDALDLEFALQPRSATTTETADELAPSASVPSR